jgi:hypothetical protein
MRYTRFHARDLALPRHYAIAPMLGTEGHAEKPSCRRCVPLQGAANSAKFNFLSQREFFSVTTSSQMSKGLDMWMNWVPVN